jgi:hypothetical protein
MNFLACDREQPFLMPPDPRDWLPEDEWRLITATHNLLKLHKHQIAATVA